MTWGGRFWDTEPPQDVRVPGCDGNEKKEMMAMRQRRENILLEVDGTKAEAKGWEDGHYFRPREM